MTDRNRSCRWGRPAALSMFLLTLLCVAAPVSGASCSPTDRRWSPYAPRPFETARFKILISTSECRLWLVEQGDTLMSVSVAVGMGRDFDFQGRHFHFETPRGVRRVLSKNPDPQWHVPDWHYYEVAHDANLEIVWMRAGPHYDLGDGSYLEIRGDQVGRVNQQGYFWPFDPGAEIIFYGKVFAPPATSAQRRVPDALGPYRFVLGDGYLIHGVHEGNADSIGTAVSHGCVRMSNEDLTRLYDIVPVGTPVEIF
jgi:hypothetical protein